MFPILLLETGTTLFLQSLRVGELRLHLFLKRLLWLAVEIRVETAGFPWRSARTTLPPPARDVAPPPESRLLVGTVPACGLSGARRDAVPQRHLHGPRVAWSMRGPLGSRISAIWELVSFFNSRTFLVLSSIFSFIRCALVHPTYMFPTFSFILFIFQLFLLL